MAPIDTAIDTGRVLIVGAGLAAQYAALKLAPRPVLMISPEALGTGASSSWAQGGVAAAMGPADSANAHARDTVSAGAGTVDRDVATSVTAEAREHILDLTGLGTPFDRTANGHYVLSREAAHSVARVVRVRGDQAGTEMIRALTFQVRGADHIQVLEGVMAMGLEVTGGRVTGVALARCDRGQSASVTLRGGAVLLAGGGSGGLYALTTNPPRIRGQVIGVAARAGARIADAEFLQFHPTASGAGSTPPHWRPRRCAAKVPCWSTAVANASCGTRTRTPNWPRATSSPAPSMLRRRLGWPRRPTPGPRWGPGS